MSSNCPVRTLALTLALLAASAARAGTIVAGAGYDVSIYGNPFDPNLNFDPTQAGETTSAFGDPTTGLAGGWALSSVNNPLAHVVSRRDGRNFQDAQASARLTNNDGGAGTPAFMQFQTATPYDVGTVITSHSIGFAGFSSPQPYTLQFNSSSPGLTTAAWSGVPVFSSGPGTVSTHPISVIAPDTIGTFDTMRIEYASSSGLSTSNSQVSFQEVVVLPELLKRIPATVTATSAGTPAANTNGSNDGQGGDLSRIWFDQTGAEATAKFFELSLAEPTVIGAVVFYADNFFPGQQLRVRRDGAGGDILFDVAFESFAGSELLPIALDTKVETSLLRFEWLAHSPSTNVASMREVVLLTFIPEPASAALMGAVLALLAARRPARV